MSKAPVSTAVRQISFAVPRWIAPIVRTALEARAKEFESAPPGVGTEVRDAWLRNGKELRRLAGLLPRTENGRAKR